MVRSLADVATEIVLTRPRQPRSAPPAELARPCPVRRGLDDPEEPPTVRSSPRARRTTLVVVTGSLFLLGDLLPVDRSDARADAERERAAARLAGAADAEARRLADR
jgi:folylpolyglutamate synthase/dihydropteroate synthase